MNRIIFLLLIFSPLYLLAQEKKDSTQVLLPDSLTYKKRVLETTEIDMLTSFYTQDGNNASVTGGIGSEKLEDYATNITIAIPLNDDDVLSIDATVSAYTSASSGNLNPFSRGDDDDDDDEISFLNMNPTASPWIAASGASRKDVWSSMTVAYSHSSDDRNKLYNANLSFATEYDYTSLGFGAGYTRLFNKKNTELSASFSAYLDTWSPQYPIELRSYIHTNGNLNEGFFNGAEILDETSAAIDKTNTATAWKATQNQLIDNKGRNTFSISLSFSQILGSRSQLSVFSDIVLQQGWLANPLQRVYFADRPNFYIGNGASIPNYTSAVNTDVFQLADDIERLPSTRFKLPIGLRYHYYLSSFMVLKTYYRYYFDDWGVQSNTLNVELPIKVGRFTFYPNYRLYTQTQADYFAPFDQHLSTQEFYTSDYDLSAFTSHQYGFGVKYTDIFTKAHVWRFGLKQISLNYNFYQRNTGLKANIVALGAKWVMDKK